MRRRVRFDMMVVLISALVLGCSYFLYQPLRLPRERERTLKFDLFVMRQAIDAYTLDKQQPPQSLDDLTKEHYLKQIPKDPFTGQEDWEPYVGETVLSPEQTITGIADVHSVAKMVGSNGRPYYEW
jgi:general secretion pathway protein G